MPTGGMPLRLSRRPDLREVVVGKIRAKGGPDGFDRVAEAGGRKVDGAAYYREQVLEGADDCLEGGAEVEERVG